jgi:AcrR family transcriptional regulator
MANERPLRADARRNRDRVVQVAAEIFATEGLAVPVHEIARRAGVGTGTVSRHFATKEDLFAAALLARLEQLGAEADAVAEHEDAGTAFFAFFAAMAREGAVNRGLAELTSADTRLENLGARTGVDTCGRLEELLIKAQQAGAVRSDVVYADIKALMAACMSRVQGPLEPLIAVVTSGLRAAV